MAERPPPRLPLMARYIRAQTCRAGCPVVYLLDEEEQVIAEAHLDPANVEPFIAQVREAAAVGAAVRRPKA